MSFLKPIMVAVLVCSLCLGATLWIAALLAPDVDSDSGLVRYGWIVPLALFAWAARASGKASGRRDSRRIAAAKVSSNSLGHAKFGSTESLRGGTGGIRLAFDKATGEVLRWLKRDGHGLVVGKTGSGKSATWQLAAILDLAGRASMILVDLKGNTTAVCARWLSSVGKLIVCNPFEADAGVFPMKLPKSVSYNPMALLDPKSPGFVLGCKSLASLMSGDNDSSKSENAAHFKERAESLLAAVIAFICERYPSELRNLGMVRDVLTSSNGKSFWLFAECARSDGSRFVKQELSSYGERTSKGGFRGRGSKEMMDVLATVSRYTDFVSNDFIGPAVEGDGFRFAPLKEEVGAVSLVCPLEHMHTVGGKWLKIMVACALQELWRNGRGKVPVYFFLDESDQYASPIIHAAVNTARAFGIVLIIMVQQLSDLEARYGKQWGTFVNGTSWKLFFASDDPMTRDYVEKLGGVKSVRVPNISFGEGDRGTKGSMAFPEQAVKLKAGYEVGEIPADELVLKIDGQNIIEAKRKPYWTCEDVAGKWDADPYET